VEARVAVSVQMENLKAHVFDLAMMSGALVLGVLHIVTDGFVIRHLWNWFVVPGIHVARITQVTGMGLNLLVGLPLLPCAMLMRDTLREIRKLDTGDAKQSPTAMFTTVLIAHCASMMVWCTGYVIHRWWI